MIKWLRRGEEINRLTVEKRLLVEECRKLNDKVDTYITEGIEVATQLAVVKGLIRTAEESGRVMLTVEELKRIMGMD